MTIVLPKLANTDCAEFTACARLLSRTSELSKRFSNRENLIAVSGRGPTRQFLRLSMSEGGHLHLDIAKPMYFARQPKPASKWSDIEKEISAFANERFRIHASGAFIVSAQRLGKSGFSTLLSLENKTPTVSMKLTGGTLSVSGAPLSKISWSKNEDTGQVELRLLAVVELELDELYLTRLFKLLTHSFRVFVLGDDKDANKT